MTKIYETSDVYQQNLEFNAEVVAGLVARVMEADAEAEAGSTEAARAVAEITQDELMPKIAEFAAIVASEARSLATVFQGEGPYVRPAE